MKKIFTLALLSSVAIAYADNAKVAWTFETQQTAK